MRDQSWKSTNCPSAPGGITTQIFDSASTPPSAFLPPKTHERDPYCWWLRNLANQLRLVVSPNSYKVWYIPGGDRRISEQSTAPFPYFKKILMGVAWEPRIGGLAVPRAWGVLWIFFPLSFSSAISHPWFCWRFWKSLGAPQMRSGKYHWPDVAGRDQLIIPSATQSGIISFWFCGRTNHQIPSLSKFLGTRRPSSTALSRSVSLFWQAQSLRCSDCPGYLQRSSKKLVQTLFVNSPRWSPPWVVLCASSQSSIDVHNGDFAWCIRSQDDMHLHSYMV